MAFLLGQHVHVYLNKGGHLVISDKPRDEPGLRYLGETRDLFVRAPLEEAVTAELTFFVEELSVTIPANAVTFKHKDIVRIEDTPGPER